MNKNKNLASITSNISLQDAAARLETLRQEQAQLEQQVRLARGTREGMAPIAGGTLADRVLASLADRVLASLAERPRSIDELARDLGTPSGRIAAAIKPMRGKLSNVGTEALPAWFPIVGDEAPTEVINAAVTALVRFKPMRFAELMAATGARQGRVSGAIVALQRDPKARIVNLDTPARARWFIVPEGIQLARLGKR
jgi:hypothetical protein